MTALLERRAVGRKLRSQARFALDLQLHRSALAGRLLLARCSALQERFDELDARYQKLTQERPMKLPPAEVEATTQAALQQAVDGWRDSSRVMADLCRERGIPFIHVLQPTLHDPGAKPITELERRRGFDASGPDERILAGYPRLRAAGAELVEAGVHFVDASRLFADDERTLFFDRCHLEHVGNLELAQLLAREIEACLEGE